MKIRYIFPIIESLLSKASTKYKIIHKKLLNMGRFHFDITEHCTILSWVKPKILIKILHWFKIESQHWKIERNSVFTLRVSLF